MKLTLLDIGGHQRSRFPPRFDENLHVRFTDSELVSYAMGYQITRFYPAVNGLG